VVSRLEGGAGRRRRRRTVSVRATRLDDGQDDRAGSCPQRLAKMWQQVVDTAGRLRRRRSSTSRWYA
jgi:hypothetical protein